LAGGVQAKRQGGDFRRDQHGRLRRELAERALIVTMTGWRLWRALVVDLNAECGRVAEPRLEIGGDPGCLGLLHSGRGKRLVIGNGDKLDDQRQRHEEGG
jgi:hypothetical protein